MARTPLILSAGPLELQLSPSIGGAISRFENLGPSGRSPVLRKSHSPLQNVLDAASFPLVPFVNRVRGGSFGFRGRTVRLNPNMPGDPSPLHGQGWLNPWTVERSDEAEALLTYRHEPGEWPWAYEASQEFQLDERGLSLTLSCRNLSDDPMPCGLGQHPYFECDEYTRLDTRVTHAWTIDEHVLPLDKVPAEGRFDLRNRPVCGQDLDHGFGGWNGVANIYDDGPSIGQITLRSPNARYFQLYSPKAGGIFVAEPVTHANAALNAPEREWPGLGMRVLEPNEQMSLDMRLDVRPA